MTHSDNHIHSQYFLNEKLAKFLLDGEVSSLYLCHMYDREEYTKDELLSAHERQHELIQSYKNEFDANDEFYGLEENGHLVSFQNEEYANELVDYIIEQETK